MNSLLKSFFIFITLSHKHIHTIRVYDTTIYIYNIVGRFGGGGKFGKFGVLSLICHTKTIQITFWADLFIHQTLFAK